MEIKIRNLDEHVVRKIDDLAAKKGISRNEYLKIQIELIAQSPEVMEKEDRYIRLIRENMKVIESNTKVMEALMEE